MDKWAEMYCIAKLVKVFSIPNKNSHKSLIEIGKYREGNANGKKKILFFGAHDLVWSLDFKLHLQSEKWIENVQWDVY